MEPPVAGSASAVSAAPTRRILPELLGLAWVTAAAVAVLIPALAHGGSLGPYNYLSTYGLRFPPAHAVHTSVQSDQITQMIPWTSLVWTQVHHGQLPLWNPYSALGTPLAFNWQSAAFSVTSIASWLAPLRFAYTVQVVLTIVIAGTGTYMFGRTLRLGVMASAFAGVVFELGGPFFGWVGWPVASVFAWSGWLLAALLLVHRGGRRRFRHALFLASVIALSIYAGQPDTLALLGCAAFVFVSVLFCLQSKALGGGGLRARPIVDTAIGVLGGAMLAAPLLLPGAQLIGGSVRSRGGGELNGEAAVSLHNLVNTYLVFDGNTYPWFAAVGILVTALAIVAAVIRRRDRAILALIVAGVITLVVASSSPVIRMLVALPLLHAVRWPRAVIFSSFAVATLAGAGLDQLLVHSTSEERTALASPPDALPERSHRPGTLSRRTSTSRAWDGHLEEIWLFGGLAVMTAVTGLLFAIGPGLSAIPFALQSPLPPHIRDRTFASELALTIVALAVIGCLLWRVRSSVVANGGPGMETAETTGPSRARSMACIVLLVCQTAFLVAASSFVWSSSATFVTPNPGEVSLQRSVGPAVVALGTESCIFPPGLGILPNVNIMLGVKEMAVYDPLLPKAYFASWQRYTGEPGGIEEISTFCPAVTSATVARRFGVGYVLTAPRSPGPTGGVFVQTLGSGPAKEDLYKVPGSGAATLTSIPVSGSLPPATVTGRPVPVTYPNPSTWKITTNAATSQVLRLHLTDVPGWRATIDGRALALTRYSGIMLQARIPPGHHTIVVTYWPKTFSIGLVLAALALVGIVAALFVSERRRRHANRFGKESTSRVKGRGSGTTIPSLAGQGRELSAVNSCSEETIDSDADRVRRG
ncbi:MAG: YfhO family protein [Acidimicrobiales bacterium]